MLEIILLQLHLTSTLNGQSYKIFMSQIRTRTRVLQQEAGLFMFTPPAKYKNMSLSFTGSASCLLNPI